MDMIWHRGVIRYLKKKELAPKKVQVDMVATSGMMLQVYQLWNRLKMIQDQDVLLRPPLKKNIDHNHQIVMNDRHLTVNHAPNVVSTSC